jgi:hypothetical protein
MAKKFQGFPYPKTNYCKVPHILFEELLADFDSLGELKVVLYVLRHTWGYQEYDRGKKITLDEFENGRKRKDGSRMDRGVGMSRPAIKRGIQKATDHGFLEVETNKSDLARIKNYYKLAFAEEGTERTPDLTERTPGESESDSRTEIETMERNFKKQTKPANAVGGGNGVLPNPHTSTDLSEIVQLYEQAGIVGTPNPDDLRKALKLYGKDVVVYALKATALRDKAAKRSWKYALGIMARKAEEVAKEDKPTPLKRNPDAVR